MVIYLSFIIGGFRTA